MAGLRFDCARSDRFRQRVPPESGILIEDVEVGCLSRGLPIPRYGSWLEAFLHRCFAWGKVCRETCSGEVDLMLHQVVRGSI